MFGGVPQAGSDVFNGIMQQKAQREADQATLRAERLQAEAARARQESEQATRRADSLEVNASQARIEADSARLGLSAADGLRQSANEIGQLRGQLAGSGLDTAPPPSEPVVNLQGQVTGQQVNVTV